MKIESMYHLTLNTGHVKMQNASEMSRDILVLLKPYSSENCRFNIPSMEGFECEVKFFGNTAQFIIRYNDLAVVECGVAWDMTDAKNLWQHFKDEYNLLVSHNLLPETKLDKMSELPFLIIILLPSLIDVPQKWYFYLGDFEQCLGWSILENAYKKLSMKN